MTGRPWVDVWSHESSATWTTGTNRFGAAVTALGNGQVLVAGGGGGAEGTVAASPRPSSCTTPSRTSGRKLPNMPTGRAGGTALLLADGSVLIVGGYGKDDDRWQECDRAGGMDAAIRYVPGR